MSKRVWTGAVIGAGAGLVAAAVMNVVPSLWSGEEPSQESSEDATVKTARRLAEPVLHRPLTEDEKNVGGPAVHFAFGASVGAFYGALRTVLPVVGLGFGTAYGAAVWLLGDEIAVPRLGLAPSPAATPVSGHLKYLAMHAVYGLTLEGTRRLVAGN